MSGEPVSNAEWENLERKARNKFTRWSVILVGSAAVFVPLFMHFMGPVAAEMRERREAAIERNYDVTLLRVDAWTDSMFIEQDGVVKKCRLLSEDAIARTVPLSCVVDSGS